MGKNKNQVLAFFAWPVETKCGSMIAHVPLNALLEVNKVPPTFQLMGLGANNSLDDADVGALGLDASILRPCPELSGKGAKASRASVFHITYRNIGAMK